MKFGMNLPRNRQLTEGKNGGRKEIGTGGGIMGR